jgi:hypothetical protein
MKKIEYVVSAVVLASLVAPAHSTFAAQVSVNCDRGQSLNRAIAGLPQSTANTVTVEGTCTEYVQIRGLDNLTVKGFNGARLVQPTVDPGRPCLALGALTIAASRSVTIDGLNVQASTTDGCSQAVFVTGGSSDVRLRRMVVTGGGQNFCIALRSQASLAGVTGRDPGWAAAAAFDESVVNIEDSVFESTAPQGWQEGIVASKATANVHGTRIRNMQVGLDAQSGGVINLQNSGDYYPTTGPTDVVVDCPAGTAFNGASVTGGSALIVAPAFVSGGVRLRISGVGQGWGGETGGVVVSDASTFDAGGNLEVSGSVGQGVVVANNSYANLAGITVTASARAGLVVINNSTANLDQWYAPVTTVSGSAGPDLFCDATSLITGGDKAPGSTRQCANVQGGATLPLP